MHCRLVSLWDIMEKFNSGRLLDAIVGLSNFGQSFVGPLKPCALPTRNYEEIKQRIEYACAELERLALASALVSARQLKAIILDEVKPYQGQGPRLGPEFAEGALFFSALALGRYKTFSVQMQDRVRDELMGRVVLVLPAGKARLFEPDEPLFGATVHSQFKKKARREIEEAGKCLALGCDTACVFHLMRTVEVAIEAIRLCLQLQAPTKGQHKAWGAVLDRFREELEGRESLTWPRQWSSMADKKTFSQIYASLLAIKDAWRDSTMHVESDYTEKEAAHIFALVKGFMEKLASRLDEDGQPVA